MNGRLPAALCLLLGMAPALAGGGPLGIDHRLRYDDSGLWRPSIQKSVEYGLLAVAAGGALWEGGDSRLGRTYWQALDSAAAAAVATGGLKYVFQRERPRQGDNPDHFFAGCCNHTSFPSGSVALVSAVITPFVLEYRQDTPLVWGLELLPLYTGLARMKVQAHWQSDVLAGLALGTLAGWWAHDRASPLLLGVLPGGFYAGLKASF